MRWWNRWKAMVMKVRVIEVKRWKDGVADGAEIASLKAIFFEIWGVRWSHWSRSGIVSSWRLPRSSPARSCERGSC